MVSKLLLFLTIIAFILPRTSCICRQSYITICTNFEDLDKTSNTEDYNELLIGSPQAGKSKSKLSSVNLSKFLSKFQNLEMLTIVKKLNRLETSTEENKNQKCVPRLEHLNFYGNQLTKIEKEQIPIMYVGKLILANNKIQEIKKDAFHNHRIRVIDISNNLLKRIENGSLPQTRTVRVIKIRNNKLTEIQPNTFPLNLHTLNLDDNELSDLTGVLENVKFLEELTLSHNKLAALPNIIHLKRLKYLDLSYNRIETIESKIFKELTKLELVNLGNNKLSDPDLLLQFLQHPNNLLVSFVYNQMTKVNLKGMKNSEHVSFLSFGNPWNCTDWKMNGNKLTSYESDCGMEYYSSGKIPYCVHYDPSSATKMDQQLKKFYSSIKKNAHLATCSLEPTLLSIHCPALP